jgi:hypothetical protein
MAFRVSGAFETLSFPSAYSFCASMMIKALSFGDAVELVSPVISRKDWTVILPCVQVYKRLTKVLDLSFC